MNIPNYYDESLITDKVKRLANKVSLSFEPMKLTGENPMNTNVSAQMLSWRIELGFQGKKFDCSYSAPHSHGDDPRVEYVLYSIFAASRMYDAFKDDSAEFYIRFRPMFSNYRSAIDYLNDIKSSHEDLKRLFGDKYKQYEQAFTSFNPLFDLIEKDFSR